MTVGLEQSEVVRASRVQHVRDPAVSKFASC